VVEWGQKATLECAKILNQLKQPLDDMETMAQAEDEASEASAPSKADQLSTAAAGPGAIPEDDQAEGEDSKPIHTEVPSDGIDLPDTSSELSEPPSPSLVAIQPEIEDGPAKKKRMTLEEYEAMLDAENGEGGFLEGGDIPSSDF
jgi:hypothetical protein